jgi:hypothetical protein
MSATRSLAAVALVALAATSASAVTLCRSKRGPVNAREACKKSETPLTPEALGVVAPTGARGAQGAAGVPNVVLVDAAGIEVGPVLSVSATASNNQVAISTVFSHPTLPGPMLVAVTGDGRVGLYVSYESTDCTGEAFTEFSGWLPILSGVQDTVYVPGPPLPNKLHVQSIEYSDPMNSLTDCPVVTARGSCCAPSSSMQTVFTTTTRAVSDLGLTPPFHAVVK